MLSKDELRSLMQKKLGKCVSIYMPTLKKGMETQQNQIRYKNLLRDTEERLASAGLRPSEVKSLMSPAQELVGDSSFWWNQQDGLAVFFSSDFLKYYQLPREFEELVTVADRFHLKPLLPILNSDIEFYILAISQNDVKIFECSRFQSHEVKVNGVPESLDDALQLDAFEKRLQLHTGTEDTKLKILQYFKRIDKGLYEFLKEKKSPLIFAGVDYLFPIYKEANTYSKLAEKGISGNPEGLSGDQLHSAALSIIDPLLEQNKAKAKELYDQNVGTGLTSQDIREIVSAAQGGRVKVLLVALDIQQWGTFDSEKMTVHVSEKPEPGTEDLLDLAAMETFLNGGTVYAVEPEEMPGQSKVVALFRF
jgi:hypothetical protein